MVVIDNLAPSKNKPMEGTSRVDRDNYKEAKNEVEKVIRTKKNAYFEIKLTENWEA